RVPTTFVRQWHFSQSERNVLSPCGGDDDLSLLRERPALPHAGALAVFGRARTPRLCANPDAFARRLPGTAGCIAEHAPRALRLAEGPSLCRLGPTGCVLSFRRATDRSLRRLRHWPGARSAVERWTGSLHGGTALRNRCGKLR